MIDFTIQTQPNDETCGPTCLHALYQYYNIPIDLETVIQTIQRSISGGTLAPFLGKHALGFDFKTIVYANNVDIFDPTWFATNGEASVNLVEKLSLQLASKNLSEGSKQLNLAYLEYIEAGGKVKFKTINVPLLKHYFNQNIPILTGLSATYLYRCARELYLDGKSYYDDIHGTPCGHFVILCGYDDVHRHVVVADPARANPLSQNNYYKVSISRLINAIMLGVLTYDANLLIIEPKGDACKPS